MRISFVLIFTFIPILISAQPAIQRADLDFTMASDSTSDSGIRIALRDYATLGIDRADASKLTPLSNPYAILAIEGVVDNDDLSKSVESLPYALDENVTLFTRLIIENVSGAFTLTWGSLDDFPSNWSLFLIDSATSDTTDLRGTNSYSFTISSSPNVSRFSINIDVSLTSRQITGNEGWRMLSFPKTGATVKDVSDDSPVQGISGGEDSGSSPNLFIYNASGAFSSPANDSVSWGDGYGFIQYFFNNATNGSQSLPDTLDVLGIDPVKDVKIDLGASFTLAGNPFNSNLVLDSLSGDGSGALNNGLKSPIYIWSDSLNSYQTINFGEGNIIPTWQGFFIETDDADSLTIPLNSKTSSAATSSFFSKAKERTRRKIGLKLEAPGGLIDQSTSLYFTEASGEGEDAFDGKKLDPLNGGPTIALLNHNSEQNKLLTQDARAYEFEGEQSYDLVLTPNEIKGTYILSWPEMINIPEDWYIELIDMEAAIITDMKSAEEYGFKVEISQKTDRYKPRFRIRIIPGMSVGTDDEIGLPKTLDLNQNFPNPFNPTTNIRFNLPQSGNVTLDVFNMLGQRVQTLVNEHMTAGLHTAIFNASGLSSGVYVYRLQFGGSVLTKKLTLIK